MQCPDSLLLSWHLQDKVCKVCFRNNHNTTKATVIIKIKKIYTYSCSDTHTIKERQSQMSEPCHLQSSSLGTGAVLGRLADPAAPAQSLQDGGSHLEGGTSLGEQPLSWVLARCRLPLQGWLLCFFAFVSFWSWCWSGSSLPSFYSWSCSLWEASVLLIRNLICSTKRTRHRVHQSHGLCSAFPTLCLLSQFFSDFPHPLPWGTGRGAPGNPQVARPKRGSSPYQERCRAEQEVTTNHLAVYEEIFISRHDGARF